MVLMIKKLAKKENISIKELMAHILNDYFNTRKKEISHSISAEMKLLNYFKKMV
jgi:hypothetical protein